MRGMVWMVVRGLQILAVALLTGIVLAVVKTHLGADIQGWIWGY